MTKATQEMHDCALLRRNVAREKGLSLHEPSLLPTTTIVLPSPQVVLRFHGPRRALWALPTAFANVLITNGYTPPTPKLQSAPSPSPYGKEEAVSEVLCSP